ncbi:alpha/beta-Hydrolase [Purpureocillium lavendulum]|uniref:Alpha/beta-Hydrolase n=1 Tax=Purpureocillium lavendulum TaxID=1247861 RepID=A0AB34FSK9_9HYPO|nr:alpha/beta-Hydrolase [Purpureocillium lavendulum]
MSSTLRKKAIPTLLAWMADISEYQELVNGCDLDFPCKRCKDDAIVCTARVRKNVEYKQLPKGYAEVLENTQLALVATIDKLYAMVRNSQAWTFGEPEFNHCGQPVIHNIAETLGCIRPNGDIDLPIHSVFPEDKEGMTELARQLEEEQTQTQPEQQSSRVELDCDAPSYEFEQSSCNVDGISSNFHNRPKLAGDDSSVAMSRHSLVSVATGSGPDRPMAINDDSFSPPQRDEQNPQKCFGLPPSSELGTSHFEYSDDGLDWLNVLHPGLAEGEYAMESDILSMQSLNVIKSDIRSIQIPDLMTSLNDSTVYVGFHSNETRP